MKQINRGILFVMMALLLFSLNACKYQETTPQQMYSAPNFSDLLPENITVVRYALNPLLDVADTAFYPDAGIDESTSWPFYVVSPGEKTMKNAKRAWAVRWDRQYLDSRLKPETLIYFPKRLNDLDGHSGVLGDHAAKRLFSPIGQMIYLPHWRDVELSKLRNIVKPINKMKVIEAKKGTKAYNNLLSLLDPFKNQEKSNFINATEFRDEYYQSHGIPLRSMLSEKQMKLVMADEAFKAKLMSFLGDNWYAVIGFPLLTPEQYGLSVIVTKVFQIPTKFWSYNLDRPGYMDRKLTAIQGGAMMKHYDNTHGFKSKFSPQDVVVLQELARQLQERK